MKYSIILPYFDRIPQLEKTLQSYMDFYGNRDDVEIIIIEDMKQNPTQTRDLFNILDSFLKLKLVYFRSSAEMAHSPATAFNEGANLASGDYLIITNPECRHELDILSELDKEFDKNPDQYVVCACKAVDKNDKFFRWYQHSEHRNRMYHFCTAIPREHYFKIQGFDERYTIGISYDDNAFIDSIIKSGITIKTRDDLIVTHLWHHKTRPKNFRELLNRNKQIYSQSKNKGQKDA